MCVFMAEDFILKPGLRWYLSDMGRSRSQKMTDQSQRCSAAQGKVTERVCDLIQSEINFDIELSTIKQKTGVSFDSAFLRRGTKPWTNINQYNFFKLDAVLRIFGVCKCVCFSHYI